MENKAYKENVVHKVSSPGVLFAELTKTFLRVRVPSSGENKVWVFTWPKHQ